jgi:hypothetical protein
LNGVELSRTILFQHAFDFGESQVSQGFWVNAFKGGGCWEFVWQNQMLERDRKLRFTMHPPVRYHFDEVLRWHGLVKRNCKTELVIIMSRFFAKYKLLNMEDSLVIAVVHKNVKRLGCSVDLRVPLEILIHF